MKNLILLLFALTIGLGSVIAQDTTWVQTFSFETQNNPDAAYDSPVRQWFQMPGSDNEESYQKILMYHRLKCFEDGTAGGLGFPCGEWDYLTYTYMFDHTGDFDSTLSTYNAFKLDNLNFDEELVSSDAIFDTHETEYTSMQVDEVSNQVEYSLSNGAITLVEPFNMASNVGRSQFLWRGEELEAAGFVSGDLHELSLYFDTAIDLDYLAIKGDIINTDSLTGMVNPNFDLLWEGPWSGEIGWNTFTLLEPLGWNGVSSLIVELSYADDEIVASHLEGGQADFTCAVTSASQNQYAEFGVNDEVRISASDFDINDQVTVSFWHYGDPNIHPANSTAFEALNASGQRVLNAHVPWSNGRVYWDAGQQYGYDRIDKLANTGNFEGRWNHWAFTKNATTGSMKMYLNGVLWHSGEGHNRAMNDIKSFSIGHAGSGTTTSYAKMDDFRIWNIELNETEINDHMFQNVSPEHPQIDHLIAEYRFEEAYESTLVNSSVNEGAPSASCLGSVGLKHYSADELMKNQVISVNRPNIRGYAGDYLLSSNTQSVSRDEQVPPVSLAQYEIQNNLPVITSVTYVQTRDYTYTFDASGVATDSVLIAEPQLVTSEELEFYQTPFELLERYELGRFITPYGINLTLDDDGWVWVYDVTDFAPLLRDSIDLIAGNWQELLDLKFAFIEGTPPRDVKRVENIWNGNFSLSNFDEVVTATPFSPAEDEEMFVLKTTTSGHDFGQGANCAEFCYNTHEVTVNGTTQYSWEIMQECADNPLFPQGGTWIYDRAGWCPGDKVTTHNWDITDQVVGNATVDLDYNIDADPYGNYVFEAQMITYGAPNLEVDASIENILRPNNDKLQSRTNPVCSNPSIVIQNKGSMALEQVTIHYGVGNIDQQYTWNGYLEFLESEEVELPWDSSTLWDYDPETALAFMVELEVVGLNDAQISNNSMTSRFYAPPVYDFEEDNRMIFMLNTNNAEQETSYTLYDSEGEIVFARDNFAEENETYRDTIDLYTGCYLLHVEDIGQDGLDFFANNDGTGYVRLRKPGGPNLITLERDFGKELYHAFVFNTDIVEGVDEEEYLTKKAISASPVPSKGWYTIELEGEGWYGPIDYFITSSTGEIVKQGKWNYGDAHSVDIRTMSDGVYHLRLAHQNQSFSLPLVKLAQ